MEEKVLAFYETKREQDLKQAELTAIRSKAKFLESEIMLMMNGKRHVEIRQNRVQYDIIVGHKKLPILAVQRREELEAVGKTMDDILQIEEVYNMKRIVEFLHVNKTEL